METTRFETFIDAIIAIIMTVLVLKIPQPGTASIMGFWELKTMYIAYLISFLILFNIWYNNHNFFQLIDTINNRVLFIYGIMIFIMSLIPYFTIWLANDIYSIPAETMFGLIMILTNILSIVAVKLVYKRNKEEKIKLISESNKQYVPLIIILMGFVLTYTVYVPGIYVGSLISVFSWIIVARLNVGIGGYNEY